MPAMNISLPEPLKKFVDGQIARGRYSSVTEYVREPIRADETRTARDRLEATLADGLRGEDAPFDAGGWQAIRAEALALVAANRSSGV